MATTVPPRTTLRHTISLFLRKEGKQCELSVHVFRAFSLLRQLRSQVPPKLYGNISQERHSSDTLYEQYVTYIQVSFIVPPESGSGVLSNICSLGWGLYSKLLLCILHQDLSDFDWCMVLSYPDTLACTCDQKRGLDALRNFLSWDGVGSHFPI